MSKRNLRSQFCKLRMDHHLKALHLIFNTPFTQLNNQITPAPNKQKETDNWQLI